MAEPEKPPPYNYNYGAIPQGSEGPPPYSGQPDYGKQQGYPPPPQPGAPPYVGPVPPGAATTTTIVTQPNTTVILNVVFRELPVSMVCNFCQTHIVTSTTYMDGTLTWVIAGGICLAGGWLGCCLIPFCIDGCKDVVHSCPNCHGRLGVYRRL